MLWVTDETLDATLVACYPHTGRTHQIRVHLFHVKHPILGDPIYGTTFEAANAYLEEEALQPQIDRLRETYDRRCTAMLAARDEAFTDRVQFTRPTGCLFTWVELPTRINARDLLALAMQEKVAFIPGDGFFATRLPCHIFLNAGIPKDGA